MDLMGLKIIQISDIHAGSFYDKEAVNKGIDLLLAQKPDLIFFTGDLVNDSATEMKDYMDVFSRLKAPLGVFSILGNHDYGDYHQWENEEAKAANLMRLKEIHAELGWRLLLDEHVYLQKGEDKIALIGVQNWGAGFHQIGDLKKAYEGCESPVKLLLSHDPTHWEEEVSKIYPSIDITFSGHTHGAQMGVETGGFKWSPVRMRYNKWAGLYSENNQYLYVNRGYGFIGYPGRIGIWPEITVMTLTNDKA
jgi:predicted MPP superfamily phosphohydrolase